MGSGVEASQVHRLLSLISYLGCPYDNPEARTQMLCATECIRIDPFLMHPAWGLLYNRPALKFVNRELSIGMGQRYEQPSKIGADVRRRVEEAEWGSAAKPYTLEIPPSTGHSYTMNPEAISRFSKTSRGVGKRADDCH